MNKDKILEGTQLGLPPMELAETKEMNDVSYSSMKLYFYPTLHKIVQLTLILIFIIGGHFIFTNLIWTSDNNHNTEIVFLTASNEVRNQTIDKSQMEILVHLKNVTSHYGLIRKKRTVKRDNTPSQNETDDVFDNITDEEIKKVRDIVMKHDRVCNMKTQNEVCKDLIMQLKTIISKDKVQQDNYHSDDLNQLQIDPKVSESCLLVLSRLLQTHYSLVNVYAPRDEVAVPVQNENDFSMQHSFSSRHFVQPQQKIESPLEDRSQQKIHPQDINIYMKVHQPRANECPSGSLQCKSINTCITEDKWCNGKVDCDDSSDELQCDCKSRLHSSRICDGYFDCPLGEDEIGCYGCNETSFSCGDVDENSLGSCFSKEQRCNNILDCPNRSDELDCSMLAPNIIEEPIFAVSNTGGYLLRNFKGKWFPVCNNPDMWAIDACQRESGLVIRPPFIQEIPVDQQLNTQYLNIDDEGIMSLSKTCFNSSAMYVTCADMLCGTRVLSDAQLINENIAIENQIFGRNKRHSKSVKTGILNLHNLFEKESDNAIRSKRAETRVVGGKPSQPAAWPWIVALYRDGTFHCGGIILNQKWVMSAAHCVTEFWYHYFEVQVGMLRRFSFSLQEKNHIVTNIIVHPLYSQENMQNDISLLKVKSMIQFGKWVRPICLPGPSTAGPDWQTGPAPGTICTAIGWGATKERGPDPDHLREVDVPIWSNCKDKDDRAGKEICAGSLEGGKDTCQGDSGGPLLCRNPANPLQWYIAGTVSHGNGCGRKGDPGVYTRVSLYRQWIRFNLYSKSLPVISPKLECPGFKCTSGIKKCIPKKRICDKIVDCLHGEDETNCDYPKMTSIPTEQIFFSPIGNKRNTLTNQTISSTDELSGFTETTITDQLLTTSDINKIQESSDFINPSNEITTNIGQKLAQDLEHASTLEISISESFESTTDNIKVTSHMPYHSSEENDRGDMQTFVQSASVESLESMSSVLLNETESSFQGLHLINTFFSTPVGNTTIVSMEEVDETTKFEKVSTNFIEFIENTTVTVKNDNFLPIQNKTLSLNFTFPISNHSLIENFIPTFEDKKDLGEKIEDMLLSEIQLPKKRRKHKTPRDFECRRMFQVIPYTERCDHKADCEDGTDELDCSCTDYISTFDSKFLCDGVFDCKDGQDEIDCFTCPENYFLCRKSKLCIPDKHVCDGKPECPQREDESNCFTLSNGHEMFFDVENIPEFIMAGYLTQKKNNDWHVICEDELFNEEQKKAAENVCHHLGFSSAISYEIKYISIKEENLRRAVRSRSQNTMPVKFLYKNVENDTLNYIPIIKPNNIDFEWKKIPKTCMALFVECDSVLVSDSDLLQDLATHNSTDLDPVLPWIAKVFVDGDYKCTGVLLDLSWVLIPHSCLWDAMLNLHFITISLGSHRTQKSHNGPYEQIIAVDMKRDLYRSKVALLHLKDPAKYSSMVKPMNIPIDVQYDEKSICVAVGQDETNKTIGVFVEENNQDCDSHNRCFKRLSNDKLCSDNAILKREWSGIISCHTKHGWYPAASFRDSRGECGFFGNLFVTTDVGYLRNELKDQPSNIKSDFQLETCEGVRCARGRCISLRHVCDGVTECENGNDESEEACQKKKRICDNDPFFTGCECSTGELKCKNGKCISKDLFNNGQRDCADGTDEPGQSTCFDYLSRVMPSRLCDGVLHCHDRSDEDPNICKCYAKRFYNCGKFSGDVEYCVPPDVVCDGLQDCPNGDDEKTCLALNSPEGAPVGTGEIIVRSHGVWHRKCYSKKTHTQTELEGICRELGFLSGHAKQIEPPEGWSGNNHNNIVLDSFHDIQINSNTTIKLRNTDKPLARSMVDETLKECYPVYIECI